MNTHHKELLEEIKKKAKKDQGFYLSANYSGSSHPRYGLSVPESRQIAKAWTLQYKNISLSEFLDLLNSLYQGESTDEKKIAGQLLQYSPMLRAQISPKSLNNWLNTLEGWEEIDSLCQSVFTYKDFLTNWSRWESLLKKFSSIGNLSKKRSSLVLLTGAVHYSNDERLANLAFANINKLKTDYTILITKAISWLLRELIWNHRTKVEKYLLNNFNSLPKIAIRETTNKLRKSKST